MKSQTKIKIVGSFVLLVLVCVSLTSQAKSKPPADNGPLFVKQSDNPAFQPYAQTATQAFANGEDTTFTFDVPLGKRLVIELFTAAVIVSPGSGTIGQIDLNGGSPNGGSTHYYTVQSRVSFGGNEQLTLTQPLRLYANGGVGTVSITVFCNTINNTGANVSISGYLVDLP